MDAPIRKQWNPKPKALAAAISFPGRLEEHAAPRELGLVNKITALRAAILAGGFHFVLRMLVLLKALNY